MSARAVYVYRLDVTYPEGSTAPDWYPEGYTPEEGYESDTGARYDLPFRWPRNRLYLSGGAAEARAKWLRKFGAHAVVVRSRAVEWSQPELSNELWTAAFELRAKAVDVEVVADALVGMAKRAAA